MLLVFLVSSFVLFNPAFTLTCHSTICTNPDEHGFCQQTCRGPNEACTASFFISPNHTVSAGTFRCFPVLPDTCLYTTCQLDTIVPYGAHCCCRRDLCNIIPGLFEGFTPPPPSILPTPPITLPASVPGDQLVCEFNNCSSTSNTNCYHGYQICSNHPDAELLSQPENHFCAMQATRTPSGLYQLQSKGCLITANATIRTLGTGQQSCILDTESSLPVISCYCDQLLCNNVTNLRFTDPSSFIGTDPDAACNSLGCSHSCVINNGVPRCLCPAGFALDTDRLTCTDINECLDTHQHSCSHICVNTNGSYTCDCPQNSGLRLASNGTTCEEIPGLVCASHRGNCTDFNECNASFEYCDLVHASRRPDITHDPRTDSCVAVVQLSPDGGVNILLQSCFTTDVNHPCGTNTCQLTIRLGQPSYHCCCRDYLCNSYFNLRYPDLSSTPTTMTTLPSTKMPEYTNSTTPALFATKANEGPAVFQWTLPTLAAVSSSVAILFVILVIVIICCWCRRPFARKSVDRDAGDELDSLPMTTQLLPRATHFANPPIGSGRFSTVYKEELGGTQRAVKVFQRKDKLSYDRELAIYEQPNFKHPNILLFITKNEHIDELQLIFEYHPNGSLYDVLNKQPITMAQFCTISMSAARGLAHLHTEVLEDGMLYKACVAHRDLKSKNILIKSDGQACISDFGLAIRWPIEAPNEAHGQVGTARYMAPEVLEGAISFDREAYFRIDMYAFSLILWELTSRTKTPYGPVSDYRAPFDDMVPSNPSIEDMKKVVVDRQLRPTIPKVFTTHSEMDGIVDTIKETWDTDADARLSAQCVYERLNAFSMKSESESKDSGLGQHNSFDSTEALLYHTQSFSSVLSGSPTNTKPAMSDTSTTLTGGIHNVGYPNAALPLTQQTSSAQQEVMSSTHNYNDQHQPTNYNPGGGGVGQHPQAPGGGNPVVNFPQRAAQNVAPPLHSNSPGGEYQYRFVSVSAFPRHPPPPQQTQTNSNRQPVNQSPSNSMVTPTSGGQPPPIRSSLSLQRHRAPPSAEHFNNRNSREAAVPTLPESIQSSPNCQYHLESTV